MASKSSSDLQTGTAYPWIIVALAAVLLLITNANNSVFGVFFKPMANEFAWSRGAVSVAIAIRWVTMASLVMSMGHLSDRHGPRWVILPSFFLIGCGFLLTSRVTTLWQLYLVQGLVMGVGSAGTFVCVISTVAKWHSKRPGLALGVASAGAGLSMVLFPPLAAGLIEGKGWQGASAILGLVMLTVAIPACFFVKDPPLTTNTVLNTPGPADGSQILGRAAGPFAVLRSFHEFLRNPQFLSLLIIFSLVSVGSQLVSTHFVNYVTDAGIGTLAAATMMSVVGIASLAGRLAMGPVSDRIGTRADAAICCSLIIAALVLLVLKMEPLMWFSAVMFGVGSGGTAPLIPAITGDYLGTENLATITGAILVGGFLGSAIGPWIGGVLFDVTHSYAMSLVLSAILTAVSLVMAIKLGPPMRAAK